MQTCNLQEIGVSIHMIQDLRLGLGHKASLMIHEIIGRMLTGTPMDTVNFL